MTECKRALVRAIGTDRDGHVEVATNYNPTAKGCLNVEGGCGCTHAEMALLAIMPHPVSVLVTCSPCLSCATALIASGVEMVMYTKEYRIDDGLSLLEEHGVMLIDTSAMRGKMRAQKANAPRRETMTPAQYRKEMGLD